MLRPAPKPAIVVKAERSPVFVSYPLNSVGRDFVIGDIHGAYDMVLTGMRQVGFNPKVDRIFCVGDLIDRGPDSARALEFLEKEYVFAVRGNHDHDFSTLSLEDMRVLGDINWNGMKWLNEVSDEKLLAIKESFSRLPIAMQIETARGTVGLVHGDIPAGMHWDVFIDALKRGDECVIKVALEGRKRIKTSDAGGVAGIGRVFVGHSIQWDGPKRLGNLYAIDTGGVFRELDKDRGALTMVNMACHTAVLGPVVDQALRRMVETHEDEGDGPFGDYATPRPVF